MLTVGSLFSGIGGIDLGLERAGMRVVWQIEKDEYAQKVLAKNFPGVPCYPDVTTAQPPAADVLAGGFPCQDISIAGKGAGLAGARSGLWREYLRIIRAVRPRYVLVENVPALRGRGLGTVLRDLAQSGYDAEWDCLPACAFGAPHRRDRIFVVAYANGAGLRERGRSGNSSCERNVADPVLQRPQGLWAEYGLFQNQEIKIGRRDWWAAEPDVGRVAHGIPSRVDRLRCLGNAVVPQVAEFVGRLIVEHAREKR